MKRFSYISADPGIPVPGGKGASIHVESVCRALVDAGLAGDVFTVRPEATELCGLPLRRLPVTPEGCSGGEREIALFAAGLNATDVNRSGCDFIYERYSLWHVGGLARARSLGSPFILEVNSPLPDEARRYRSLTHGELAETIGRVLVKEADGVVCVSEEVAAWVRDRRGTDRGVWVVPNGVDDRLFRPSNERRRPPLPPAPIPIIAFAGSFRPWHGVEDLLESFALLVERHGSNAHLLCIGDGPLRESFEEQARDLGVGDRVHVTGLLSHDEVPAWLNCADVAVAPYPKMEDFYFSPLKIFEAMALGLPVVAADIGQIPCIVASGDRGKLYRAGDVPDLADALAQVLSCREEAERVGRNGRRWILENATWSRRVDSILSRIEQL